MVDTRPIQTSGSKGIGGPSEPLSGGQQANGGEALRKIADSLTGATGGFPVINIGKLLQAAGEEGVDPTQTANRIKTRFTAELTKRSGDPGTNPLATG